MKGKLRLTGGRKLKSPSGEGTRPTTARVREAIINIFGNRIKGSSWLDLFSGSGVMSCEVLQRGAARVVAVDCNKKVSKLCKENIMLVAESQPQKVRFKIINRDVIDWLSEGNSEKSEIFDFIYIDPPYQLDIYYPVLNSLITGNWVNSNSTIILEQSSDTRFSVNRQWVQKDKRAYGKSSLLILSPV